MSRNKASSAYKTPGTRMVPQGAIRQRHSASRFSFPISMNELTSYINDTLRTPKAVTALRNAELGVRGAFDFDSWLMPFGYGNLATQRCCQVAPVDDDLEMPERQPLRAHFENEGIQPF